MAVLGYLLQTRVVVDLLELVDYSLLGFKQAEKRRQLIFHVSQLQQCRSVLSVFPLGLLQLALMPLLDRQRPAFAKIVIIQVVSRGANKVLRTEPAHVLRHSLGLS